MTINDSELATPNWDKLVDLVIDGWDKHGGPWCVSEDPKPYIKSVNSELKRLGVKWEYFRELVSEVYDEYDIWCFQEGGGPLSAAFGVDREVAAIKLKAAKEEALKTKAELEALKQRYSSSEESLKKAGVDVINADELKSSDSKVSAPKRKRPRK